METGERTLHQAWWDLLWLTSCALHGETPNQSRVREMNLALVYKLAESQTMTGITYSGLEPALAALTAEGISEENAKLLKKWREARDMAIRKVLLLDAERRQILNYMDSQGIWYVPLKGILLKELYPKLGMRQMSDNDIWFDSAFRKQMGEFMLSRGYRVEHFGTGNHDEYEKEPVYNFELHSALYMEYAKPVFYAHYEEVKKRLIKDGETGMGHHMSTEECYGYILSHIYKHHEAGGTGIRAFADCYLYNEKLGDKMKPQAIREELIALGLLEFEQMFREIAKKLFSKESVHATSAEMEALLTEEELQVIAGCFGAGTYGTEEKRIANSLQRIEGGEDISVKTKIRYFLRRIFPPMGYYKEVAPLAYRYKVLIPFYWLGRLIEGFYRSGDRAFSEIKSVLTAGKKKGN